MEAFLTLFERETENVRSLRNTKRDGGAMRGQSWAIIGDDEPA